MTANELSGTRLRLYIVHNTGLANGIVVRSLIAIQGAIVQYSLEIAVRVVNLPQLFVLKTLDAGQSLLSSKNGTTLQMS